MQGGSGPMAPAVIYPRLLNALGGTKFKMVTGYGGAAESCLAMEKGEIDGCLLAWSTVKAAKRSWLDEKKANIIVQWGATRHPELPEVPSMVELGRTPDDRAVLALYASATEIGKSIVAPPGVPADRVMALAEFGLAFERLDAPVGAAWALKLCFAGTSKGQTALLAMMTLLALREGVSEAFLAQLARTNRGFLEWGGRQAQRLEAVSARWAEEMDEIELFAAGLAGGQGQFGGLEDFFAFLASAEGRPAAAKLKDLFAP